MKLQLILPLVFTAFSLSVVAEAAEKRQCSKSGKSEGEATYLVIDLSGGATAAKYPVSYMIGVPAGGWTDEYKTTKLVLRKCSKGADPLGRYTLTKDFFAGVFEVTQKQWNLVMGSNFVASVSQKTGDIYPACYTSYLLIRGSSAGIGWPASSAVDADSFIGKLRAKTGLSNLDLPTEAQWEYACRAGTTTKFNLGDSTEDMDRAGWHKDNSGNNLHPVGQKIPNKWGLYDMHGNSWEWCLDWWSDKDVAGTDPVGPKTGGYRSCRSGGMCNAAPFCASSTRDNFCIPSKKVYFVGLRLFKTCP